MSLKMNFSMCTCDALLVPDEPRHAHQKLIKNVSIFNGESEELITGYDVVLEGHKIHSLIPAGSSGDDESWDTVIDGKGGYLTPGLIDIHWHTMFSLPMPVIINKSKAYVAAVACVESKKLLMRGVTTVRDAAGDVFGIKQAIDEGIIEGPRIYGSGAILSQYSGHGDFRNVNEVRIEVCVCVCECLD
jgi:imidazolonepropionase-like amidohydrolase